MSQLHLKLSGRPRLRRCLGVASVAVLLLAVAAYLWTPRPEWRTFAAAASVIDGDSLLVKGDTGLLTIRLSGIDAPEYRQSCTDRNGEAWACGKESRSALVQLVGDHPLQCALSETDRYGRRIGRCFAHSGENGTDLAAALVSGGWAIATEGDYRSEQETAKSAARGIWRGRFLSPAEWRAAHSGPIQPGAASDKVRI